MRSATVPRPSSIAARSSPASSCFVATPEPHAEESATKASGVSYKAKLPWDSARSFRKAMAMTLRASFPAAMRSSAFERDVRAQIEGKTTKMGRHGGVYQQPATRGMDWAAAACTSATRRPRRPRYRQGGRTPSPNRNAQPHHLRNRRRQSKRPRQRPPPHTELQAHAGTASPRPPFIQNKRIWQYTANARTIASDRIRRLGAPSQSTLRFPDRHRANYPRYKNRGRSFRGTRGTR